MLRKKLRSAVLNSDQAALDTLRAENDSLSLAGETFQRVHMVELDLSGLDLTNTEWEDCLFDRVRFDDCDLTGAYITGSTFLRALLNQVTFSGTAIDGCVMREIQLTESELDGVEITNSQLQGAILEDLTLIDAEWDSMAINEGRIARIKGTSGLLKGVTLRGVEVSSFETEGLELKQCFAHSMETIPSGFQRRSGKRKRL